MSNGYFVMGFKFTTPNNEVVEGIGIKDHVPGEDNERLAHQLIREMNEEYGEGTHWIVKFDKEVAFYFTNSTASSAFSNSWESLMVQMTPTNFI